MNKQDLIKFEKWTVDTFNAGKLNSPVHLAGGNEEQLIEIFKEIKPNDWVFSTYRSHYHALLKGISPEWLKEWILNNKSIHVMNKEHRFFTSAIVGGCLSIALGTAMTIKLKGGEEKVWCFIGDMTASLGVFKDCFNYAISNKLPITFVIENNGLSTDTNTGEAWGINNEFIDNHYKYLEDKYPKYIRYYKYTRVWPHYGSGKFIASLWKGIK